MANKTNTTEVPTTTTPQITVGTGVKVATTKPVSEMQTKPPMAATDSVVEINKQAFTPPTPVEQFNHTVWNELLTQYVTPDGKVNYDGFRKNSTTLRAYIKALGENMPNERWTKNDKLAYWMNAYNAMTVDLIVRNLPLASIKDIDKPWDQRLWKLGEKWYNLDEIEHKILRKMDEPRIHFGINCASFSCPPLLNAAFTSKTVDFQLEQLTATFINDTKRNTITSDEIKISKIFNWFAKDFKQNGSLIDFLNTYASTTINNNARVRYLDYNWSLNN